jgi:uncharacterized protein YjgD (DUF1641 family)
MSEGESALLESEPFADADEAEIERFLERLRFVNELLDVAELGKGALDDEMVASLASTGGELGAAADAAATPETTKLAEAVGHTGDDLGQALETLARLQANGTLDELAALADVVPLLTGALDDEMVTTLARAGGNLGEVADAASDPDTVRGLTAALDAVSEASDPSEPPEALGTIGLLRAFRDPDVKRGMGFMVAVAGALGDGLAPETEN